MSALAMFIPLTKVDAEKRLVYGVATAEAKDRSGETCDYALSKPNFEKWSADAHAASGGLSKGNLRAMHGKVAAGKLEAIHFNDDKKQVEICAKVVDDGEWKKVQEGVYTGFSQGGSYGKRWTDEHGVKRYEAKPNEISLVDLPCLASATFEMVKGEGLAPEVRHFAPEVTVQPPSNSDVAAKAAELAKAAGREDFGGFVEAAREELIKAALPQLEPEPAEPLNKDAGGTPKVEDKTGAVEGKQMWVSDRDGSAHATKADLRRHHGRLDAEADMAPARKVLEAGAADAADGRLRGRLVKAAGADAMAKGLSAVSRLASIMQDLAWLQQNVQAEAVREGDGSGVPASIMSAAKALGESLKTMTAEEVDEMFTPAMTAGIPTPDYYYNAAGMVPEGDLTALVKLGGEVPSLAGNATLAKLGARNNKADAAKIQAMHDHACDLGATCKAVEKAVAAEDLAKAAGDLAKAETARDDAIAERDIALAKYEVAKDMTEKLSGRVDTLTKTIAALPRPAHLEGRAISKEQDGRDPALEKGASPEAVAEMMKNWKPEEKAQFLIKASLAQPHRMGG